MNKLTAKDFKRGIRVVKSQLTDFDKYPVYQNSLKPLGFYSKYNVKANTVFVICAGAAGDIGFSNKNFWAADDCYYLETDKYVDSKFIYYYLLSIQNDIKRQVRQASVPRLGSDVLKSITLPSVSDNKQQEIVKILDSFTNLIDALNEELSLRQKQFEYYREKLLNSNECSKTKKLQYFAKIMNGKDYKHLGKGQIPLMGSGGIMGYVDSYLYNKKSVLLSRKGSIDKVYYIEEPFWTVDTLYWTKIDEKKIIPKFLYYILSSIHIENYALNGGIPSMTQSILYNIDVPYIDKDLQQSIVEKLDAFESLISSLKEEIALRQKQYEYYREKLLTFD